MKSILVEVCAGTHCTMMGAMNILDAIHSLEEFQADISGVCDIRVVAIPCMNLCRDTAQGPFVRVDGRLIPQAESESVMAAIMSRCQQTAGKE
ncbi:MAG: NAD(P)H-dependent oxidoreductase subunit E [Clostridiales bacterium]|nr:NAD(P)H-dependent oxidoreductase subunit E [Clostridiales bacterium]